MCLAIVAPKNTDKNSDFLFKTIVKASDTNRDGMGFAFKRNSTKKVYISKGYKEVGALIDSIKSKKLGEQDELLVHARIGNKGAVNEKMCHPFVASEDPDEILLNDKFVDRPVFVHNGTFNKVNKNSTIFSDTYYFAKDILGKSSIINFLQDDSKLFEDILTDYLNNSRVAVLFPNSDQDLITLGTFIEDKGYLFSNTGYKETKYTGSSCQTTFDWDEYWKEKDRNVLNQHYNTTDYSVESKVIELLPTFRVPDDIATETIVDPVSKYEYRKYLGFLVANTKTIQPLRIVPTPLNFHHLLYQAREYIKADKRYNYYSIDLMSNYKVAEFDCDYTFYKNTIHYLYKTDISDPTPIPYEELIKKFDAKPLVKYKEFYKQYLQLVSLVYPGKNTLKKLSKLLKSKTSSNSFSFSKINVDGTKANGKLNRTKERTMFQREVLELYQFNLIEHIFGNSIEEDSYEEYLNYSF